MKKALLVASVALLLVVPIANAVELTSISLGFHLNPAIEAEPDRSAWGLSLSLGAIASVGESSSIEVLILVDSAPSSLGATFAYHRDLADPFAVGAGLNMFWMFATEQSLIRTVLSSFAHATARTNLFPDIGGEASLSFPLVTFARQVSGWEILPLAELPAIHLAGDWHGFTGSAIEGRVTLQPVITDTTQFLNPIGRISDDLLVLPTYSLFLRYLPQ
jgi:hypothetical protein